jgi:hypothetical protein
MNGPKNNDKKMKWLVEPTGILVLDDVLFEEERECIFALQFNPLLEPEECLLTTFSLFLGPFILKGLVPQTPSRSRNQTATDKPSI